MYLYVSAEDSVKQVAYGALGGLRPVEVWRSGSVGAKNVLLLKTSRLDQLERRGWEGIG